MLLTTPATEHPDHSSPSTSEMHSSARTLPHHNRTFHRSARNLCTGCNRCLDRSGPKFQTLDGAPDEHRNSGYFSSHANSALHRMGVVAPPPLQLQPGQIRFARDATMAIWQTSYALIESPVPCFHQQPSRCQQKVDFLPSSNRSPV